LFPGRRKDRRRKNRGGYCLKRGSSDTTLSVNPNLPHLFSKTVNASQHCLFKNLCLPRKTKYLVYRHFVNNSHAFFAFDDLTSATVDVWRWNVNTTSGRVLTIRFYETFIYNKLDYLLRFIIFIIAVVNVLIRHGSRI
jgi:hypothetical protein